MRAVVVLSAVLASTAACATGTDGDSGGPDGEVTTAPDAASPIDAPRPDAAPAEPDAAAPPPDAAPAGPNDTCAQALDVTTGAMGGAGITLSGDTTGYANDLEPSSACTGYTPDGADAVYVVDATAGQTITATVTPVGWDTSIYVTTSCQLTPTCVAGTDTSAGNDAETVTYTVATSGIHYVVVDGWNPGVEGAYAVNVRLQ